MLKIKINQDIDGYSEGLVMGLSIKEIGHLLLICVCEIVLVILLSLFLPFIAAIYLSIPFIICMAFFGRKIGNMSIKEIIQYMPVYNQLKRGIEYSSTEEIEHVTKTVNTVNMKE